MKQTDKLKVMPPAVFYEFTLEMMRAIKDVSSRYDMATTPATVAGCVTGLISLVEDFLPEKLKGIDGVIAITQVYLVDMDQEFNLSTNEGEH